MNTVQGRQNSFYIDRNEVPMHRFEPLFCFFNLGIQIAIWDFRLLSVFFRFVSFRIPGCGGCPTWFTRFSCGSVPQRPVEADGNTFICVRPSGIFPLTSAIPTLTHFRAPRSCASCPILDLILQLHGLWPDGHFDARHTLILTRAHLHGQK